MIQPGCPYVLPPSEIVWNQQEEKYFDDVSEYVSCILPNPNVAWIA
jgi:hypothetical protein